MTSKHLSLLLLLALTSCYNIDRPEKPEHLLSKEKMVAILVDLSLMTSAKSVNKKIIEENGITPDEFIYKTHGVDSITFAISNDYYAYEITDYEEIYLNVKDSLNTLKKKYTAIEAEEKNAKKIKDSINRAKKDKAKPPQKLKKLNQKQKKESTNNDHEEL